MDLITIQDSFEEVISDVQDRILEQDKFWIARRNIESDENQDFWYINVNKLGMKDETDVVNFQSVKDKKYEAKVDGKSYDLQTFYKKVNLANNNISSVAISSNSNHLIVGTKQGDLIIYNLRTDMVEHNIKGAHFEDITILKVFPSDKVIMSVGIDLKIKIWGLTGELVRTMANQTKEITNVGLLGKTGRNFASGSRDGSIHIWECGTGQLIYSLNRIQDNKDPVNCFIIGECDLTGPKLSELEYETENQCIYVGYDSGIIQQFNIGDHCQTRLRFYDGLVGVSSIDKIDEFLVCGYNHGQLKVWDIVNQDLMFKYQLNSHNPILSLNVLCRRNDTISVLVYNGPETLLRLEVDIKNNTVDTTYLVGMEENFRIHDVAINNEHIVIGSSQLTFYK